MSYTVWWSGRGGGQLGWKVDGWFSGGSVRDRRGQVGRGGGGGGGAVGMEGC